MAGHRLTKGQRDMLEWTAGIGGQEPPPETRHATFLRLRALGLMTANGSNLTDEGRAAIARAEGGGE